MSNDSIIPDAEASPLLSDRSGAANAVAQSRPDFRRIKAIYFDLDDTLCRYWDASRVALRQTFAAIPIEGRTVEEMVLWWATAFRGFAPNLKQTGWYETYLRQAEPTRTELMRRTLELIEIADDKLAFELGQTYAEKRDQNLKLFSDAIEVLESLGNRFPLGLITNGPADTQRQEIATLGIEKYLSHIFIEGEMGEGKPRRSVFDRAANAVNCQPHEILMVGNSFAHDISPALEYGWHAIWTRRASDIPPSATSVEAIPTDARMPDAIVQHLSEILELF